MILIEGGFLGGSLCFFGLKKRFFVYDLYDVYLVGGKDLGILDGFGIY